MDFDPIPQEIVSAFRLPGVIQSNPLPHWFLCNRHRGTG